MQTTVVGGNILCARRSTTTLGAGGATATFVALILLAAPSLALSGAIWDQQAKLEASDVAAFDQFGQSVAIDYDTAVVGSPFDDNANGANAGAAYVYDRDPVTGTWSQDAKLTASDGAPFDNFGYSVAISCDKILVGARNDDDKGMDSGSAYVFVRDPVTGAWSQDAKLTASDGAARDDFGRSVALDGDTALVGAQRHDKSTLEFDTGAAYVFVQDSSTGTWSQQAELTANDGADGDEFGHSVALDGGTAVIGARYADRGFMQNFGAAYVFVWCPETGDWQQQAKLTPSNGAEFDDFGWSVGVSGDTAVVGAPFHDASLTLDSTGSAYIFVRDPWLGVWTEQAELTASDEAGEQNFGWSVAIDGATVLVGAIGDNPASGSAYVFVRDCSTGTWFEQAKLVGSDGDVGDEFGFSVAVQGDTAIVGAPRHDQALLTLDSGAAYVFVRITCC